MESAAVTRIARPSALWQAALHSRAASLAALAAFFWIVAAAGYSGFMGKWGLRDESPRFAIGRMLDASAQKPFVYRQLVPMFANAADRLLPERLKERLIEKLSPQQTFVGTPGLADPALRFRYMVICYVSFVSLFLSLFVLREIALAAGAGQGAALLAPAALALAFPYLQTVGGYFYDSVELLFFSAAFLAAARGRLLWLIALAVPATLNKETFFFFIPALYPLLRLQLPSRKAWGAVAVAVLASGLVNAAIKFAFADAPGGAAEFHLFTNLAAYLTPSSYRQTELTYGLVGPSGASLATLLVGLIVLGRGWPACPVPIKRHLLIAAAINLPLFLVFGFVGELRNLSLTFVGFTVVIAFALGWSGDAALNQRAFGAPK